MFTDRPTGELVVLLLAVTICSVVLFGAVSVAVIELIDGSRDTSQVVGFLADVLNTLIGVTAGFLAGATQTRKPPL